MDPELTPLIESGIDNNLILLPQQGIGPNDVQGNSTFSLPLPLSVGDMRPDLLMNQMMLIQENNAALDIVNSNMDMIGNSSFLPVTSPYGDIAVDGNLGFSTIGHAEVYGNLLPTSVMGVGLAPNRFSNVRSQDAGQEEMFSDRERSMSSGAWERYSEEQEDDYPGFERDTSPRDESCDEERFVEEDETDWQERPSMDLGLIREPSFLTTWSQQSPEGAMDNILPSQDGSMLDGQFFDNDQEAWFEIQDGESPVYSAGQMSPEYLRSRSPLMDFTDSHSADRSPVHSSYRRHRASSRNRSPNGSSGRRSHFRDQRTTWRSGDRSRRDSRDRLSRRDSPNRSRSRRDSRDRLRSRRDSPDRSSRSKRDSRDRFSRPRRNSPSRQSNSRRDSSHTSLTSRRRRSKGSSPSLKASHEEDTNKGSGDKNDEDSSSGSNGDIPDSTELDPNEAVVPRPVQVVFVKGMNCPACTSLTQTFKTLDKFMNHWRNYHAKFQFVYSCPMQLCSDRFPKLKWLINHVEKKHNNGAELCSRLETFLRQEIKGSKEKKKPKIDPGNLTFDPVDNEQLKKVKKSSLTIEAVIVESLLDKGDTKTVQEKSKSRNSRFDHKIKAGDNSSRKLKHQVKALKAAATLVFRPGMVCPICPQLKKYKNRMDYRNHWISCHVKHHKRYRCPHINCSTAAVSLPNLKKHYQKCHNIGNVLSKSVSQMLDGVKSEMIINEKFVDPGQNYFDTENERDETVQVQNTTIVFQAGMTCPACTNSRTFPSEYDFCTHWQLRHMEFCDKYPCPVHGCISTPISLEFLRRHYRKFHSDGQEVGDPVHWVEKVRTKNSRFVDPGKFTYDPEKVQLEEEMESEMPDPVPIVFKPGMKCPICPKTDDYQKAYEFRNHWLNIHIEFKEEYTCPHTGCTSKLVSEVKLLKHYKKQHNDNEALTEEIVSMLSDIKSERIKNLQYVDPGKFTFDHSNEEFKKKVTFDINPNISVDTV